jgi:hypothetical protein
MISKRQAGLEQLFDTLITTLNTRLDNGDYTAADLSVIRQLLKDNNIQVMVGEGHPIDNLIDKLPFTEGDEEHGDEDYSPPQEAKSA